MQSGRLTTWCLGELKGEFMSSDGRLLERRAFDRRVGEVMGLPIAESCPFYYGFNIAKLREEHGEEDFLQWISEVPQAAKGEEAPVITYDQFEDGMKGSVLLDCTGKKFETRKKVLEAEGYVQQATLFVKGMGANSEQADRLASALKEIGVDKILEGVEAQYEGEAAKLFMQYYKAGAPSAWGEGEVEGKFWAGGVKPAPKVTRKVIRCVPPQKMHVAYFIEAFAKNLQRMVPELNPPQGWEVLAVGQIFRLFGQIDFDPVSGEMVCKVAL